MIGRGHRGRVDSNQKEIVKALRQIGCSVVSISRVGDGVPDLLVGRAGRNILLEVKDGSRIPSARKLSEDEQKFADAWRGQVNVVESVDHAVQFVLGYTGPR